MDSLWDDIRHGLRALVRQRGLTASALVTLALGIGVNTAIFSVVYGVLLRPLPYPEPDRLVRVSEEHPGANAPLTGAFLSDWTMEAWTRSTGTLEGIAAYGGRTYTVGREDPVRLPGAAVSPALFSLLRATAAAGRFFDPDEALEGASDVVVLGHGLWQERFGGSAAAIGELLVVDGKPHTIVGVARPDFAFPSDEAALWTPYVLPRAPADGERTGMRVLSAVARLLPGVTAEQAAAEGTAAARSLERPLVADLLFGEGGPVEVRVRTVAEEMTASVRPALQVLGAGVGCVLLIACANVANLLLSHGLARKRELAVRSALGASRARIARQLLTESLLVSAAGGIAGWIIAAALVRLLPVLAPEEFPRLDAVQLDAGALAFATAAAILAGLGSGLLPALRGARAGLSPSLHEGDERSTGAGGERLRMGLLAAEAGLAVVLVVAASLLLRSFVHLAQVDSGYDPANVLTAQVFLSGADAEEDRAAQFITALTTRLQARPDVVAAGAANMAPFGGSTSISGFALPAAGPDRAAATVRANTWVVTPGFGDALGLRVEDGRFLRPEDIGAGTQALVVNEEFVRLYLADGRPVVGRRYPGFLADDDVVTEIVGVVGNVLKDGPNREPQPEIYVAAGAHGRSLTSHAFLLVRTTGDPLRLAADLRRIVRELSPLAALDGVGSLAGRLSSSLAQPRFAAAVLASFALLSLTLAATGLYGVMSYNVSRRRREMGVRAALGASHADLLRLVLAQGLSVTALGLVLGLCGAAAATRLMQALLFGVGPLDLVAFSVAPAVLLIVALLACLLPARRAAAVDPAVAFRSE